MGAYSLKPIIEFQRQTYLVMYLRWLSFSHPHLANRSLFDDLRCLIHNGLQLTEVHDVVPYGCIECFLCGFD